MAAEHKAAQRGFSPPPPIQTRDSLLILDWLFLILTSERKELGNNSPLRCGRYHVQQVRLPLKVAASQRGLV